jgi:hypothetical protein
VRSEDQITTFSAARGEGDARRRRPGSRRSTSARTVYAGADLASDLPWARGPQAVAVVLLPGGRRQMASRLPSRRQRSERADLRSPWAAWLDERRGRRQAARDRSRFRGLSRPRLLAYSTAIATSRAIPFRTQTAPDPRASQPGAAGSILQSHLGFAGLAHSGVPATPATPVATNSGRAAVIVATIRGDASPQGAATPRGFTADPAHNRPPSAGRAQPVSQTYPPCFGVSTPSLSGTPRTTDGASFPAIQDRRLLTDHIAPITAPVVAAPKLPTTFRITATTKETK